MSSSKLTSNPAETIPRTGKEAGFSLIEVLLVMVLLGTLVAIAAPRFIDLSETAETSACGEIAKRFDSAARMVFVRGRSSQASNQVVVSGIPIDLANSGYPAVEQADSNCDALSALWQDDPERYAEWFTSPTAGHGALSDWLIRPAHATPPPPPPAGGCDLPDLLLLGDAERWQWASNGSTGTFTGFDHCSFEYDEQTGLVSAP